MEELEKRWEEILLKVKNEHNLTDITFYTWLKPLKVYSVQDGYVVILFASEQTGLSYLSKKFALPLKAAIAEVTGMEYEIRFIMPEQVEELETDHEEEVLQDFKAEEEGFNLNPNFTFDAFIVDNNNQFAFNASKTVAESPGQIYNPLFIYGGGGLGKTHLLQAIANDILRSHPDFDVLYASAETFADDFVRASHGGSNSDIREFRDKYRNVDVLLIDDVQFFGERESVQEEFFHIFNELHIDKKQIILASDRAPEEIKAIEERLRLRFQWGLVAYITPHKEEKHMDIYRFFNSKDIAEHLKRMNYEFNLPEAAFIVYQSEHRTLEEKCEAWRELINTMPDCSMKGNIDRMPIESFHQFLRDYMALQKKMLQMFLDSDGFIYTYDTYAADAHSNSMSMTEFGDHEPQWDDSGKYFSSAESAFAYFKKEQEDFPIEEILRVKFWKIPLLQDTDPESEGQMCVEMTTDLEAIEINIYGFGILSEEEENLNDRFDWMWFAFPTPFKRGDILIDRSCGDSYLRGPFVLDTLYTWDAETLMKNGFREESPIVKNGDKSIKRLKKDGDVTDMDYSGVFLKTDGQGFPELFDDVSWTYLNLERFEEPLQGMYRVLKPVSSAMTYDPEYGDAILDQALICTEYQLILTEQMCKWNRCRMEGRYTEEGQQLAGLKERTKGQN